MSGAYGENGGGRKRGTSGKDDWRDLPVEEVRAKLRAEFPDASEDEITEGLNMANAFKFAEGMSKPVDEEKTDG